LKVKDFFTLVEFPKDVTGSFRDFGAVSREWGLPKGFSWRRRRGKEKETLSRSPLMKRSAIPSLLVFLWAGAACAQQTLPVQPIPGPGNLPAPGAAPAPAPVNPAVPPVPSSPSIPAATTPVVASPVVPATYTVQAGDNPWTIAKKHGVKLEDLLKANEIKDPKNLKIGDVLKLPSGATAKPEATSALATPAAVPAAASPNSPAVPAGSDWEFYTVQKGDNPWKIAKALKVEHQKIVSLNEGVDFTRLKIGQQIKVPKKP
jgi:LysM repeat protein